MYVVGETVSQNVLYWLYYLIGNKMLLTMLATAAHLYITQHVIPCQVCGHVKSNRQDSADLICAINIVSSIESFTAGLRTVQWDWSQLNDVQTIRSRKNYSGPPKYRRNSLSARQPVGLVALRALRWLHCDYQVGYFSWEIDYLIIALRLYKYVYHSSFFIILFAP